MAFRGGNVVKNISDGEVERREIGRNKGIRAITIPIMAGDGVSTRLQKEVSALQQDMSKMQEELARLEAKMDTKFLEFKEEFRGDL
ncbi:hypothetical protein PVK06_007743 [Gossypium arboreum]|uniref:Uncharacterized protein n=1 Tax=Gossypium arboreum TaxID=29729 RepID=A0ABR0QI65_GOSAR|nr:hypothetical protein PVK06_007743 [Gossypium arboreum]